MNYLELAPAIGALRSRPGEFEFSNGGLHHLPSRHTFRFLREDDLQIDTSCGCSRLQARPEQVRLFHAAFREWQASYWRPLEINREFAAHFEPPAPWRRLAIRLLRYLVALPPRPRSSTVAADLQAAD